jgi:hypothetical protein
MMKYLFAFWSSTILAMVWLYSLNLFAYIVYLYVLKTNMVSATTEFAICIITDNKCFTITIIALFLQRLPINNLTIFVNSNRLSLLFLTLLFNHIFLFPCFFLQFLINIQCIIKIYFYRFFLHLHRLWVPKEIILCLLCRCKLQILITK